MELKSNTDRDLSIETALQYLYDNRAIVKSTDFTLISKVSQKHFTVHKLVLAIRSAFFSDIVHADSDRSSIEIADVNDAAIENMIRYFYDKAVVLENPTDITGTKKLADRYQIPELSKVCIARLADINIDVSNVVDILEVSLEFRNQKKEEECLRLISKNTEQLFRSEQVKTMSCERTFQILDKLKTKNLIAEAELLHLGLQWMEMNNSMNKIHLLLEKAELNKLSMNEFIDIIISYPKSFNNIEISRTMKEIKCRQEFLEKSLTSAKTESTGKQLETELFRSIGINTETKTELHRNIGTNIETESELFKSIGTNTENKTELHRNIGTNTETESALCRSISTNTEFDSVLHRIIGTNTKCESIFHRSIGTNTEKEETEDSKFLAKISLSRLTMEDGRGAFDRNNEVLIKVHDDVGVRRLFLSIPDEYRTGVIGSLFKSQETEHVFYNISTSFEGIFHFINCYILKVCVESITPLQQLEVLEAAYFFEIQELTDKVIDRIRNINSYDPLFLDRLRHYNCFKDRFQCILKRTPNFSFFHSSIHFISFDLLTLLLKQRETHGRTYREVYLLLNVIEWLENRNLVQSYERSQLLKLIYFEDITFYDFKTVVSLHPKFFSSEEMESIFTLKSPSKVFSFWGFLPEWYNFDVSDQI